MKEMSVQEFGERLLDPTVSDDEIRRIYLEEFGEGVDTHRQQEADRVLYRLRPEVAMSLRIGSMYI